MNNIKSLAPVKSLIKRSNPAGVCCFQGTGNEAGCVPDSEPTVTLGRRPDLDFNQLLLSFLCQVHKFNKEERCSGEHSQSGELT